MACQSYFQINLKQPYCIEQTVLFIKLIIVNNFFNAHIYLPLNKQVKFPPFDADLLKNPLQPSQVTAPKWKPVDLSPHILQIYKYIQYLKKIFKIKVDVYTDIFLDQMQNGCKKNKHTNVYILRFKYNIIMLCVL